MSTKLIFFILFSHLICTLPNGVITPMQLWYFYMCHTLCRTPKRALTAHSAHSQHARTKYGKKCSFLSQFCSLVVIVEALMLSYFRKPKLGARVCESWNYEIHVIPQSGYWWICCKCNHYEFPAFRWNECCSIWLWWEIVMHKKENLHKMWVKDRHASRSARLSQTIRSNVFECASVFLALAKSFHFNACT